MDGDIFESQEELVSALSAFSKGGGSGEGAVESVTGDLVTGTAENPIINLPTDVLLDSDTSNVSVADKVVKYSNIGAVNTAAPQFPENAVPLAILDFRVPTTGGGVNNFLRLASNGTYSFVEAGRDFIITDFTTSITISRTYMSGNRKLVFDGVDLEITIPESASFTAGYNFTVVNKNSSPISILTTGLTSLISVGNLTHIAGYGEVYFNCLGSNVWKLSGELTSI